MNTFSRESGQGSRVTRDDGYLCDDIDSLDIDVELRTSSLLYYVSLKCGEIRL